MKKYFSIFLAILIGTGAFLLYSQWNNHPSQKQKQNAGTPTDEETEKVYFNDTYHYNMVLPPDMEVEVLSPESIHMVKKNSKTGEGPSNFVYVSIVPASKKSSPEEIYNYHPEQYKKLMTLQKNGLISVADPDQKELDQYFTFTRGEDTTIDGTETSVFKNTEPWEFLKGTTETRYILEKNDMIIILGAYTGDSLDLKTATSIIQTFTTGSS